MTLKVLCIGGTGWIGGACLHALRARGAAVAAVARGKTPADPGVQVITADRRRLESAETQIAAFAPDIVLDSFAMALPWTEGVLALCRRRGLPYVMLSSQDVYQVYGALHRKEAVRHNVKRWDETAPLRSSRMPYRAQAAGPGDWLYDYDKIPIEEAARALPGGTVLRLPMTFGPGDPQDRFAIARAAAQDGAVTIARTYAAWRTAKDHIANVADAVATAVLDDRARNKTLNVGSGWVMSEGEWMLGALRAKERSGTITIVPDAQAPAHQREVMAKADLTCHFEIACSRIRQALDWVPPLSLDEALKTLSWNPAH